LPIKHLDEDLLTLKNKRGQNLLYMIALGYEKQRDERNLKEIIKTLSKETLMEIKGLDIKQEALNIIVKELNKREILSKIKGNELDIEF
jgi:hypothetical protein